MHFVVPIAFFAFVLAGAAQPPISQEDAARRACAFLDVAYAGLNGAPPQVKHEYKPFYGKNDDWAWCFDFSAPHGFVRVDKDTGHVVDASTFRDEESAIDQVDGDRGVLSNAQVLEVCQRLWEASGRTGKLVLTDRLDDQPHLVSALACPTVEGVPFHDGFVPFVTVGWKSGRLESAEYEDMPKPPRDLHATFPARQAEAIAVDYLFANMKPNRLVLYRPVELCMWNPYCTQTRRVDRWYGAEVASLEDRDETMLVYSVSAYRPCPSDEKDLDSATWYEGIVDAKTGVLLAATGPGGYGVFGGPSGGGPQREAVPFGWDLAPGPTSVLGATTAFVPKGDVSRIYPKNPPTKGVKLILKRTRTYIPVEFDAKSGLLWTGEGKLRSYGRPNAPLLKALKAAKPAKTAWPKPNKAK